MRTLSATEDKIVTGTARRAFVRVSVRDGGGTFRDLTTYPEFNFVRSVDWSEGVDDNGMTAKVTCIAAIGDRSLVPFHATSPLNTNFVVGTASSSLLAVGREVKIEAGVGSDGDSAPAVWNEVFRGYIDALEWPGEEMMIDCVGLEAKLRDTWIETERVYAYAQGASATKGCLTFETSKAYALNELVIPSQAKRNAHFYKVTTAGTTGAAEPTWPTGSGSTVVSGGVTFTEVGACSTTTGTLVENVIQQIINDGLGAGAVTLFTPVSPAWAIRSYAQQRQSVLDAIKDLANQIGWSLRYRWDAGTSAFRLTLYDPGRSTTTPARTFAPSEIVDVSACRVEITEIRNVVQVIYPDSTDVDPKGYAIRKTVVVSDSASITKYGRRFMEISEGDASNLNTSAEATTLANAALSDLKDPGAEYAVEVPLFPWVQLGDLLRFAADGRHFTANQDLAVVQVDHTIDDTTAATKITTRGKPASGLDRWLDLDGRANSPEDIHSLVLNTSGETFVATLTPTVGGQHAQADLGAASQAAFQQWFEVHASKTSGFTPSKQTLKASGANLHAPLTDLEPGERYYVKHVPFTFNAGRPVRGLPSEESSFVATRAQSAYYDSRSTQSHLPLNGNFEHAVRDLTTSPPDHWEVDLSAGAGTEAWGAAGSCYWGTDANKGRYISLRADATRRGSLISSPFEVRRGVRDWNIYLSIRRQLGSGVGSPYDLIVDILGYADAALTSLTTNLSVFLSGSASGPYPALNTWYDTSVLGGSLGALPSNTNFIQIRLRRSVVGSTLVSWDIGDIYAQEADFGRLTVDTLTMPAWTAPSYLNSWTDYNAATHQPGGYLKDPMGFVRLRGLVRRTVAGFGTGVPVFQLPVGYRPAKSTNYMVVGNNRATRLEIDTAGNVTVVASDSATPEAFVSLDGVNFDTR